MKIKFNSDDDLPLNKQLKFINLMFINLIKVQKSLLELFLKKMVSTILKFSWLSVCMSHKNAKV